MSRKPATSFPESFFESDLKPLLVVVLVPLVIYLQTLWYGFTPMDEHWLILNNEPFLKEPGNIWRTFLKPTCEVYYRPLMMSSFIVDYKISHLQPFSYHLTNIILHLGN